MPSCACRFGPASSMADVAQHGAGVLNPLLDSGSNALGQGALADILRSAPDLPSDAPAGLRPAPPAAARKSSYSLPGFPDGQVRGSSLSGSIKDGPLSRDNSMSGSLPALLPVPRSRSSALLAEGNSRGEQWRTGRTLPSPEPTWPLASSYACSQRLLEVPRRWSSANPVLCGAYTQVARRGGRQCCPPAAQSSASAAQIPAALHLAYSTATTQILRTQQTMTHIISQSHQKQQCPLWTASQQCPGPHSRPWAASSTTHHQRVRAATAAREPRGRVRQGL